MSIDSEPRLDLDASIIHKDRSSVAGDGFDGGGFDGGFDTGFGGFGGEEIGGIDMGIDFGPEPDREKTPQPEKSRQCMSLPDIGRVFSNPKMFFVF